jgi:hypothetical protein
VAGGRKEYGYGIHSQDCEFARVPCYGVSSIVTAVPINARFDYNFCWDQGRTGLRAYGIEGPCCTFFIDARACSKSKLVAG